TRNGATTPASPISPTRTATPGSSRRSATAGRLALGGFRGEQATVERLAHGGGAVTDAELGVDVHQVGLDRGLADEQPGGRLPVGGAGRHQLEDLEFPLAERARSGRAE